MPRRPSSDHIDKMWGTLNFNTPDLTDPKVMREFEAFIAKYARPEPVAFQLTKESIFQFKERVEGTIADTLQQIFGLLDPPPVQFGAVRAAVPMEPPSDLTTEEESYIGRIDTEDYFLNIAHRRTPDGKELIRLQIIPKTDKAEFNSQLTIKICDGNGEIILEEVAPFDDNGNAKLEMPEDLPDGDYAIIVE